MEVRFCFAYLVLQEMPVMMLSTDETTNKAVFCAGVPDRFKELDVTEWCTVLSGPLKGKCGKAKSGLASGPVMIMFFLVRS